MTRSEVRTIAAIWALCSACGGGTEDHAHHDAATPDAEISLPPLPAIDGLTELMDENPDARIFETHLTARAHDVQLLSGNPTPMWNYNDALPGPLLHVRVGDRVIIHFSNELDESTIIHWHGLRISDQMDGSPRIQSPIEPGGSFTYDFVVPDAGTFWYHTHINTIEQLERGLYGAIVVHEATPPVFAAERIFVADDVRLTQGSNRISAFQSSGPDVGAGRVGNTLLLNGKAGPTEITMARGAIERWRFVLANNALAFGIRIRGAAARVISTDGGLLPQPFDLDRVQIAPGQRYDFEVRANPDATEVELEALIQVLDENNQVVEDAYTLVHATVDGEMTMAEPVYPTITLPSTDVEAENLNWVLNGGVVDGQVRFTINGISTVTSDPHDHPLLHTFEHNVPVKMTISSMVSPAHPFHIHGQFFQIIARNGQPVDEPGLRDTVHIRGSESATILSYFDNPGKWMVHCHITEHSERGMMAEIQVGEDQTSSEHHNH